MRFVNVFLSLAILAGISVPLKASAGTFKYQITGLSLSPTAINANGVVVGQSNGQAAIFIPTLPNTSIGTLQLLGNPAGDSVSKATGINSAGTIVGYASNSTNDAAFQWTSAGGYQSIPALSFAPNSYAYSINSAGQVVGTDGSPRFNYSSNAPLDFQAFAVNSNGSLSNLAPLPPASSDPNAPATSYGRAINSAGEVVGSSQLVVYTQSGFGGYVPVSRACYWTPDGQVHTLDLPSNPNDPYTTSSAAGINDAGTIIGSVSSSYGSGNIPPGGYSFIETANGSTKFLDVFGYNNGASGINNLGQVIGGYSIPNPNSYFATSRPYLFSDGVVTDLNSLIDPNSGWTLTSAIAINDAGEIIGSGTYNGQQRSFILTNAVPEFSSAMPLCFGLPIIAIGLLTARKRQKFILTLAQKN